MAVAQAVNDQLLPGREGDVIKTVPVPRYMGPDFVPGRRDLPTPQNAAELNLLLNTVNLRGNTVITTETLSVLWANYLGQTITLATLFDIANQITKRYRNQGYVLSQAVIPEQEIDGTGQVNITIIEGFLSNVAVEGIDQTIARRLQPYLAKLKADQPLTARVLERYMLLINDLAGVNARAVLSATPNGVSGASDLLLQVSRDRTSGHVGLSNRGSEFFGPTQLNAKVSLNGLVTTFGQSSLVALTTGTNNELHLVALSQSIPIGSEGTDLTMSVSASDSEPGQKIAETLAVKNSNRSVAMTVTHPVIRSRQHNLSVRGQLALRNSESKRVDERQPALRATDSKDRVRAVRTGLTYDRTDSLGGVNIIDVEVSQGLDIFGATRTGDPNRSRRDAEHDFTKLNLYGARLQRLPGRWSVLASVQGQASSSQLPSAEQFGVGGPVSVRGYDSSEIVGDKGVAGALELRYARAVDKPWLRNFVGYLFIDAGRIGRNSRNINQPTNESRSSTGVGVRFHTWRETTGYLEFAKPISDEIVSARGTRSGRVFFSLTNEW